ncbi:hypothetical protein PAN31117_03503 [Pandoraea anapnoica]|uniref:Uncharacterized protein n=1 Tax=Pandoraea anapnoica TaxID=2508301 RepID=A0A5E5A9V7_9BURK|nr:hypothetical protein [Pandoraea anapnoica]VVE69906.1 hypothetical protein PAN31117_03503 [Pandoraea anapnoica]
MSPQATVPPSPGHPATVASRRSVRVTPAEALTLTRQPTDEKSPRDSQLLTHAKRALAVRREPPRAPDIERYLRRWLTAPPALLITLASDDELLARNTAYPLLAPMSRRFGDIGYSSYLLTQRDCGQQGTHLRTCVVSITHGCDVVTFPALQAWTDDGDAIIRAEALSHLYQTAERLKATTPVQHLRRQDFYRTQTLVAPKHLPVVQSTHRTARLGMWLAATGLLDQGNASLDTVLRDIRIGSTKFDPTFRQHQELTRLARTRHRRGATRPAHDTPTTDRSDDGDANTSPGSDSLSSPLSRTFPDARPAFLPQRCR